MSERVGRLERRLGVQDYKLNALLDVTRAINSSASDDDLLGRFRRSLAEHLKIDRLALYVADEGGTAPLVLSTGCTGALPSEVVPSADGWPVVVSGHGEAFDVDVPVLLQGEPAAVLYAGVAEEGHGVSPVVKHFKFIQTLTNVLVVALKNRQFAQNALRQEATRRELELAAELQAMLVPTSWPEDKDVDLSALYRPHREVGGDYYDVFAVNPRVLAFCMADVSGKGISAAFVMSNFQANVRTAFQFGGTDLELAVRGLNSRVMESARGEKYITLFMGLYDRSTRRLQYVNCGHNPPLLMMPDGSATGLVLGSVGLGMFPELPSIEVGEVDIPKGSVLVCYTDGLVEQEDREGIPYGNQRLEAAVRERRGMGAAAIQAGVLDSLEHFRGATPAFDDTALLTAAFR